MENKENDNDVMFGSWIAIALIFIAVIGTTISVFLALFLLFCLVFGIYYFMTNDRRKLERENNRQERLESLEIAKYQRKLEQERILEEQEKAKEQELHKYQQLRKDIEAMPEYEHWRQAVFKERGRKCTRCGSTENLEIDHRFKSFYAIIKEYGVTNTNQAYECPVLWSVDNGAPLCKTHHDETTSSIYRQLKMSINKI